MEMLPQSNIYQGGSPFEPINEIHVHGLTTQQLFLPTSESRHFTREDAAKAFGDKMLPADKRLPIPELVELERDLLRGQSKEEAKATFERSALESENALARSEQRRREREANKRISAESERFEFRFQNINVDDVGKRGRSRKGTGWRYGVPFHDRKRGEIKIPTKVE